MPVGTVQLYDGAYERLHKDANRQWDDATAGNLMWVLADENYTPADTHVDMTDITGEITGGDGAPIALTTPTINAALGAAYETFYTAADADFGTPVTITAKYLICVQPAAANTFVNDATTNLIFYVDLDTTTTSTTVSSVASEFIVQSPTSGWFKISQA